MLIAPLLNEDEITDFNARIVPVALTALETRKARSFWATEEDFRRGYNEVCTLQRQLLMGGVDRIVSEIRALRQGDNTPIIAQDPLLDPYTLNLIAVEDIVGSLNTNNDSAAFILSQIRTLLQASAENDAIDSETLAQIAAIIVGV